MAVCYSKNTITSLFVNWEIKVETDFLMQMIPTELNALMGNPATAEKAKNVFMKMKKSINNNL